MTKKKVTIISDKKFQKELKRKRTVKEKRKLSDEQVNTAMLNIDLMESKRREAINTYLEENNFIRPDSEAPEDKGKAVYLLAKTKYILEKVNLSENISKTLEEEIQKFSGLYQITDIKTRKKGQIFQVNFIEVDKKFKIIKLLDAKDMDPKIVKSLESKTK